MPELSEKYLEVLLKVKGKDLDARIVNPLIKEYDDLLKNLKVEEQRRDGKTFKAFVDHIVDRKHEVLDKDTLICSRQVKWNIHNPSPRSQNNLEHHIYALIHRTLMQLAVKRETARGGEIVISTIDTNTDGGFKKGKWPMTDVDRAFQ